MSETTKIIDFNTVESINANGTDITELWYKTKSIYSGYKEQISTAKLLWKKSTITSVDVELYFLYARGEESTKSWTIPITYSWEDVINKNLLSGSIGGGAGISCSTFAYNTTVTKSEVIVKVGSESDFWLTATVSNKNLDSNTFYIITKEVITQVYVHYYGSTFYNGQEVSTFDNGTPTTSSSPNRESITSTDVYYKSPDLSKETTLEFVYTNSKVFDPRIIVCPSNVYSSWILNSSEDYEDSTPDGSISGTKDTYSRTLTRYTYTWNASYKEASVKYNLVRRTRGGEDIQYLALNIGDNTVKIGEEDSNYFLLVTEDGTYVFSASSDNAFIGYEEKMTSYEGEDYFDATWVEGTYFELRAKEGDVLYICCSTQDFSPEVYNLNVSKKS